MSKNNGKNISKILSGKWSQKILDHAKQSATDTRKTVWTRATEKAATITGNLIEKKMLKNYNDFTTEW